MDDAMPAFTEPLIPPPSRERERWCLSEREEGREEDRTRDFIREVVGWDFWRGRRGWEGSEKVN